jgi:phosphohistidine swiveling domain-containing protein
MDSRRRIVRLRDAAHVDVQLIGGKAAKLAQLTQAGFRIPDGFCITTSAYEAFLAQGGLIDLVRMELGRKPLESMRWEEIWDTALRIRSGFAAQSMPEALRREISEALHELGEGASLAVRSSAPGEDAAQRSFAGLHESVVGVRGAEAVFDAVKTVWASLWSDAALLYRKELSLDPVNSRMAVLVQRVVEEDRSGVAFARDPRGIEADRMIVEAVPGPCSDLVDGAVDPDRWVLARDSGSVVSWQSGDREQGPGAQTILEDRDLAEIYSTVMRIEAHFSWPPDMEWTGRASRFTVLQARPITTVSIEPEDKRAWYLTLRPSMQRLRKLRIRVADTLIPQLKELGERWVNEPLEDYDDRALAGAIDKRAAEVARWKEIYWGEFIPFAHGVRRLGTYYNDAVHPQDPYEFTGLLKGEEMLAMARNESLARVAGMLRRNDALRSAVRQALEGIGKSNGSEVDLLEYLPEVPGSDAFREEVSALLDRHLDVSYRGERLSGRPDLILRTLIRMASQPGTAESVSGTQDRQAHQAEELTRKLLDAVGPERRAEAEEVIATARLSWRLRDDDNILVGRLEAQLLRAVRIGSERLVAEGRLDQSARAVQDTVPIIAAALRDPSGGRIALPEVRAPAGDVERREGGQSPRQLIGQPAAPGVVTGRCRCIRSAEDLGRFEVGEVMVCDAIEPTMTHLVPLAGAVVERRGGMLIHGATIARELGIPCVNGVARATELLADGELLTVDGYLGIVTVGPAEFDLEGPPTHT